MAPHPRIAFLTGAGFSIPAGMPSTKEITDKILCEKNVRDIYFGQIVKPGLNYVKDTTYESNIETIFAKYINELKSFADSSNTNVIPTRKSWHQVNYEDLYYLLIQMNEYIYGDFNPYGKHIVEMTRLKEIVLKYRCAESQLIERIAKYIRITVVSEIEDRPINLEIVTNIAKIFGNDELGIIDVFSLNHDLVFEKILDAHNITYTDGFCATDKGYCEWHPEEFDRKDLKARVLKLHGSVDWNIRNGKKLVKPNPASDRSLREGEIAPIKREFLVGTHNKIGSYLGWEYWELFERFRKYLNEAEVLIVIGYSFGDQGINAQIVEWFLNMEDKKIIVVDKKDQNIFSQELPFRLRLTGRYPLLDDKYKDKVFYFDKGVEEFSLTELNKLLEPKHSN